MDYIYIIYFTGENSFGLKANMFFVLKDVKNGEDLVSKINGKIKLLTENDAPFDNVFLDDVKRIDVPIIE